MIAISNLVDCFRSRYFLFSPARKFCKYGWREIGGLCYRLGCTVPSTWESAQAQCHKSGANLARINNRDDMNTIFSWLKDTQHWTGKDAGMLLS